MRAPAWLGRVAYIVAYPGIRLFLWRSHRVYVCITHDDKLLLTQNWMGLQHVWRLAGGGSHHGEMAIDTAMREAGEELGVEIPADQLQLLNETPIVAQKGNYTYDIFVWRPSVKPLLRTDQREIYRAEWFLISDVPKQLSEHAQNAIKLTATMQ